MQPGNLMRVCVCLFAFQVCQLIKSGSAKHRDYTPFPSSCQLPEATPAGTCLHPWSPASHCCMLDPRI